MTCIGIVSIMNTGNYSIQLVGHLSLIFVLLKDHSNMASLLSKMFKNVFYFPLFFFLFFLFFTSLQHIGYFPLLLIYKGTFLIILNLFYGAYLSNQICIAPIKYLNFFSIFYLVVFVIVILVFFYIFSDLKTQSDMLRLKFENDDNLYQTFSSYLLRFYLVGFVILFLLRFYDQEYSNFNLLLFIFGLVCSIFSMIVGSNKEPVLFIFLSLFSLLKHSVKFFLLLVLTGIFLYYSADFYFDKSFLPRLFQDSNDSINSRLEIFGDFYDQVSLNIFFGTPLGFEILNQIYVHSFFPSIMTATGLLGFFIFLFFMFGLISRLLCFDNIFITLFMILLIMANIASYFDWFPFWFFVGLLFPLIKAKFRIS